MSQKSCGDEVVSQIAVELREGIVELAGERTWAETRERWLDRAARRAGISFRSAYAIFYQQVTVPRAETVERVRLAIKKKRERDEASARREAEDFIARLEAVERYIRTVDPDYAGPHADGYRAARDQARAQMLHGGGEDRSLGEE